MGYFDRANYEFRGKQKLTAVELQQHQHLHEAPAAVYAPPLKKRVQDQWDMAQSVKKNALATSCQNAGVATAAADFSENVFFLF